MSGLDAASRAAWLRITGGAYTYRYSGTFLSANGQPHDELRVPITSLSISQDAGRWSGTCTIPRIDTSSGQAPVDWRPLSDASLLNVHGARLRLSMEVTSAATQESVECKVGTFLVVTVRSTRPGNTLEVTLGDCIKEVEQAKALSGMAGRGHSHRWAVDRALQHSDLPTGWHLDDPSHLISTTATIPDEQVWAAGTSMLEVALSAARMSHPANTIVTDRDGRLKAARFHTEAVYTDASQSPVAELRDGSGGHLFTASTSLSREGAVNGVVVRVQDSDVQQRPTPPSSILPPGSDYPSAPITQPPDGPLAHTPEGVIYNWLRIKGLSAAGACGLMGNIAAESNFKSDAVEPNGVGHGLCQWSFSRKDDLFAYASSKGVEWHHLWMQLEFIEHEMTTVSSYAGLWDRLKTATDAVAAAKDVAAVYERPGIYGDRDNLAYGCLLKAIRGDYHVSPVVPPPPSTVPPGGTDWNAVLQWEIAYRAGQAIELAHQQIGVGEHGAGFVKYADEQGFAGQATEWCGLFVSWIMIQKGVPLPAAGAPSWTRLMQYIPDAKFWLNPLARTSNPRPGDIVLFTWDHAGIVVDVSTVSQGWITVIEGNASERVMRLREPLGNCQYFYTPDWAKQGAAKPRSLDAAIAVQAYAESQAAPAALGEEQYLDSSSLGESLISSGGLRWGGRFGRAVMMEESQVKNPPADAARRRAEELLHTYGGLVRQAEWTSPPMPWLDTGDAVRLTMDGSSELVEVASWRMESSRDGRLSFSVSARGWRFKDTGRPGVLSGPPAEEWAVA